jgi:hypothetical protein
VRRSPAGFTTIQYVVATGLSLLLFVLMANLLVDLYARGAVRDALDEGVRAGIAVDADPVACATRAREVVRSIVGGSLLRVDDLTCERHGDRIVATARVSLHSWLPTVIRDWRLTLRTAATRER